MKESKYDKELLKKYIPAFVFTAVIILAGLAVIIYGAVEFKIHDDFVKSNPETTAVCKDVSYAYSEQKDDGPTERYYSYHLEYTVEDVVYRTDKQITEDVKEGETVEISYDPDDPNIFRTHYFSYECGIILKGVFVLAVGALLGSLALRKCRYLN